ncbi:MAG: hypothetical protein GY796_16185 [Chloroflexi bacterium]|nr:hypothetical protein [Chloroflexota bacterium]
MKRWEKTAARIIFVAGCAIVSILCGLQAAVSVVGVGCLTAVGVNQSSTIYEANSADNGNIPTQCQPIAKEVPHRPTRYCKVFQAAI